MSKLHNVAYVTPVIGVIRLGHMEEKKGKRLPQKDDFFTITGMHKEGGQWVRHRLHEELLSKQESKAEKKLREIPVRVLYSDTDLNSSERYEAYDNVAKRLVCAGDGRKAKRLEADGRIGEYDCPGDQYCQFGREYNCATFTRTLVQIEGQDDALGAFILRSQSYNGFTTLRSRLTAMHSLFGEKLPHVPLKLVLRTKSAPLSMHTAFYYADLVINGDLVSVAKAAGEKVKEFKDAGIDVSAFEQSMKELYANGGFSVDPSETFDDREEFCTSVVLEGEGSGGASASPEGKDASIKVTVRPMKTKPAPQPAEGLSDLSALFRTDEASPAVQEKAGSAVETATQ